jgi:hypothetical protein
MCARARARGIHACSCQGLDSRAKNLVTLGNLLLLPLVILFLNSLPWQQSIEAAKFYISNNCQANGGIFFFADNHKLN